MPYCPACRDEFRFGFTTCPDHGVALVEELPPEPAKTDREQNLQLGVELGMYERVVAPILIDLLAEHEISAFIEDSISDIRRTWHPERTVVLVSAENFESAQAIVAQALPVRLQELEEATAADASFVDEELQPEEEATKPWGQAPEEEAPEDLDEIDDVAIGAMEPAVARVLGELCAEVGIGFDTEYSLDDPAPPWARDDGRVRVHIEELLVEEALQLIDEELPAALSARGITASEPLLDTNEP